MLYRKELEVAQRPLIVETGKVAKQADGAVWVQYGGTVILSAVVSGTEAVEGQDFFPLTVDYREKSYAAGKIPGGFFKREGRPRDKEILSARLIDRPIRPLFPDNYMCPTMVAVTVLSSDQENDADILGIIGSSAALTISDIPFDGPIGAVRLGKIGGEYVVNPTFQQLEESTLDIIIAGTADSINMVEGEAKEIGEEEMLKVLKLGHEEIRRLVEMQVALRNECGQPKRSVVQKSRDQEFEQKVIDLTLSGIKEAIQLTERKDRKEKLDLLLQEAQEKLAPDYPDSEKLVEEVFTDLLHSELRRLILKDGLRPDGRRADEIRPITCEVGVLPRTHGSALFTRGQTQALTVTTLGTKLDEQKIDDLEGKSWKAYMLHYNFPPFSVGEVRPIRGPGRREVGHGYLAERALEPIIPQEESFPYTIRVVSDILESNGSSSMATVCAGSLSLMDAGVPVKAAVAGIAMGLVKEDDQVAILTDILGDEDHIGDMDFKVAGTRQGITAFQMDVKVKGISNDILKEALERAKKARLFVLDMMEQTISHSRPQLSPYAPRIVSFKVNPEKIGSIIGPGGRTIREITGKTDVNIEIDDDGTVYIWGSDEDNVHKAKELVNYMVQEPEVGKVYAGKVIKIMEFGAFVEILPGQEGLLHISQIDNHRIGKVTDVLQVGDEVKVKLLKIDRDGKLDLSRKVLLREEEKKSSGREHRY
ncbi:polyribonucleotide nucleotidyltransferase [candidate division KSB1 bacterium]|nr:polyribonucleotide nucleotidyltransferase [candidate division KSB1 bacterium]